MILSAASSPAMKIAYGNLIFGGQACAENFSTSRNICTNYGTLTMRETSPIEPILEVRFYKTSIGTEPVREWLRSLDRPNSIDYRRGYQDGSVWVAVGNAVDSQASARPLGSAF